VLACGATRKGLRVWLARAEARARAGSAGGPLDKRAYLAEGGAALEKWWSSPRRSRFTA